MGNIEISNTDNTIDVRDIIARVEELETRTAEGDYEGDADEAEELTKFQELLDELKGNGRRRGMARRLVSDHARSR